MPRVCVCVFIVSGPQGEAAQTSSDGDQTPDKNKKKNRCFSCRKKVGLTGEEGKGLKGMQHAHTHTEPSAQAGFKGLWVTRAA